jgi:DNA-binding CsgD family transcriptional regulator
VLFRSLLQVLPEASATRRVHHAEGAGLDAEVQRLAPLAAADAARAAAHRQAAALYTLALVRGAGDEPGARAGRAALLGACAEQHELIAELDTARALREQAAALQRAQGDRAGEGLSLCGLARLHWLHGDIAAGKRTAAEAIEVLSADEHPRELGMAYAVMAQLHLLDATHDAARDWGERALALAERCGDDETLVHALNTVGSASLVRGDRPEAWARLQRSLALALERNWSDHAARAYLNLIVHSVVHRRHQQVRQLCDEARAYCEARDFELYVVRLRVRHAWALQETCDWDGAAAELEALLAQPGLLPMDRAQCTMQQALLRLRRGPDAAARRYAAGLIAGEHRLHPTPWYAPPAPVAAEMAWLLGRPAELRDLARRELSAAVAWGEPWRCGQLAVWLRRLGALEAMPPLPVAAPCTAELRGDLAGAAAAWAAVGNRYQQGLTLLGGDAAQLQQALALFEGLDAQPAAALARRRLRELGQAPRGRNKATRADPLGLTPRERALVQLLAEGLSDRAIAERWHRSVRTVEHHVAHLLAKLGLQRRSDVAALAAPVPAPS